MPYGYVIVTITANTVVRFAVKEPHIHYYTPIDLLQGTLPPSAVCRSRSRGLVRWRSILAGQLVFQPAIRSRFLERRRFNAV